MLPHSSASWKLQRWSFLVAFDYCIRGYNQSDTRKQCSWKFKFTVVGVVGCMFWFLVGLDSVVWFCFVLWQLLASMKHFRKSLACVSKPVIAHQTAARDWKKYKDYTSIVKLCLQLPLNSQDYHFEMLPLDVVSSSKSTLKRKFHFTSMQFYKQRTLVSIIKILK